MLLLSDGLEFKKQRAVFKVMFRPEGMVFSVSRVVTVLKAVSQLLLIMSGVKNNK